MQSLYIMFQPHTWEQTSNIGHQLMDLKYNKEKQSSTTFFLQSLYIDLQCLGMVLIQPLIALDKVVTSMFYCNLKAAIQNFYQGIKNELFFMLSTILLTANLFYSLFNSDLFFQELDLPISIEIESKIQEILDNESILNDVSNDDRIRLKRFEDNLTLMYDEHFIEDLIQGRDITIEDLESKIQLLKQNPFTNKLQIVLYQDLIKTVEELSAAVVIKFKLETY